MPLTFRIAAAATIVALAPACHRENADAHVQKAQAYLDQHDLPNAILELRRAEQIADKRGDIREKLAAAYMQVPDLSHAYAEYVRAADLLPNDINAQLAAGNMLLLARQFEDAKSRADKALAIDAKNIDAQILRGNALARLKQFDAALAEYQDVIALDPTKAAPYANIGTIQQARGDLAGAEASFRKAVAADPKSVAARLALANFLWSTGHAADAEETLKDTLAIDPTNVAANRALGAFYMASNRAPEAEPYFKALAEKTNSVPAVLALADYYAAVKRNDDARTVLTALVARNGDGYAEGVTRLAALDATDGQHAQAAGRLRELLTKKPAEMPARLLLARLLLADGKSDDGLKEATSIVTDDPTSTSAAQAYMLIGNVQAANDHLNDAIQAYQEVLKRVAQPVGAEAALAAAYLKKGALPDAEAHARQALQYAPKNPGLQALQIRVLLAQGRTGEAGTQAAALLKAYPNSPTAFDLVGENDLATKQVAQARDSFNKALLLAPKDLEATAGLVQIDLISGHGKDALSRVDASMKNGKPSANLLMLAGRAYAAQGDLAKAEDVLKQAIQAEPARLEAYGLLGGVYIRGNRLADAADEFRQVVAADPKSVSAGTMLGMIYEAQHNVPAAERQYQAVLAIDGRAPVAANNLAWIYADGSRNLDQALQLAQAAAQALPNEPHVNDTLGWVYYRKGLASEAVPYFESSIKADPKDPTTHYHLGMAYLQSGDRQKARQHLSEALSMSQNFDGAADARKALDALGR